jgi:hypothetical protein
MQRFAIPALLATAACAQRPEDSLFYRETWEAFVLGPSGVIEATASVSNQGLRRRLGTMLVRRVRPDGTMVLLSAGPTSTVEVADDHRTIRVGSQGLGADGLGTGIWRVQGSEEQMVAFAIDDRAAGEAPQASWLDRGGAFRVEVPIVDGRAIGTTWSDSSVVSGAAVALHRGGDGIPSAPRRFLWAIGLGVSLGYDGEGEGRVAWIVRDGTLLPADDATITSWTDTAVVLEIPSQRIVATFHPGPLLDAEVIDPSWLGPERWALALSGVPTVRDLRTADAQISQDGGDGTPARALVLEER